MNYKSRDLRDFFIQSIFQNIQKKANISLKHNMPKPFFSQSRTQKIKQKLSCTKYNSIYVYKSKIEFFICIYILFREYQKMVGVYVLILQKIFQYKNRIMLFFNIWFDKRWELLIGVVLLTIFIICKGYFDMICKLNSKIVAFLFYFIINSHFLYWDICVGIVIILVVYDFLFLRYSLDAYQQFHFCHLTSHISWITQASLLFVFLILQKPFILNSNYYTKIIFYQIVSMLIQLVIIIAIELFYGQLRFLDLLFLQVCPQKIERLPQFLKNLLLFFFFQECNFQITFCINSNSNPFNQQLLLNFELLPNALYMVETR
eukprot:TRINITY_DN5008_c0_g1_i1.p1 TRINITY_DN5008_c0_g1~~TRINITY_DN5008_c0_g1_i1.p1  ORF type:complete len:317 (+),score=-9.90 TRINITY_DN5008_c0_g1_i1:858-1808(+)